jgi:tetraprenyl-beta-curcumene synthase
VFRPGRLARRTDTHRADICPSGDDSAPLTARQLWVLATSAARELVWGLPAVACELRAWRTRATAIPDAQIRGDALTALDRKRGNTNGAALFWTVPRTRSRCLLRLLVAYQAMWDCLDCISERGAIAGQANGRQLHLALVDALDPGRPISDHYRHHPWRDDGGYLAFLVQVCRERFSLLPSSYRVGPLLAREATRANVQAINHDLDAARRETSLRAWAAKEFPAGHEATWYELAGAAGAGLSIYALLVQAVEPECTGKDVTCAYDAYFPWASAVATMLDSYVDQVEDAANGDHVYVAHYPTPALAVTGMGRLVRRSLKEASRLRYGERHVLILASMVAMYLSKESAGCPTMCDATKRLANSGGSLTRLLLPVLRLWRVAYAQRSA